MKSFFQHCSVFKTVGKIKNKDLPPSPIFSQNLDENLKIYLVWPYTTQKAQLFKSISKSWPKELDLKHNCKFENFCEGFIFE